MSKLLFLAATAVAGVSTVATVYYVSPVELTQTDAPPILVDAKPSQVVQKIRTIDLERYAGHLLGEEHRERDALTQLFDLVRFNQSDTTTIFDLKLGNDLLMQFRVEVIPVQGSKSEVEITAVIGDNPFSSNPALHPYDLHLLQSVADFVATDYVSSIVKGHPALSGNRLEHELEKRYAADKDSIREAARRVEKTFMAAYGDYLKSQAESYAESAYDSQGEYDEEYAEAVAEQTAEDAMDAADRAGQAAAAAGAAANAAAATAIAEGGGW